jgi:hypothetical protein
MVVGQLGRLHHQYGTVKITTDSSNGKGLGYLPAFERAVM